MSDIEQDNDGFVIDAAILASGFKRPVNEIKKLMQEGRITSVSEIGEGEDEGRRRITFYHDERAFRLVLNADNTIRTRGTFPVLNRGKRKQPCRVEPQ